MSQVLDNRFTLPQKAASHPQYERMAATIEELRSWFDAEFSLWDAETAEIICQSRSQPEGDQGLRSAIVRGLHDKSRVEIVDDADAVVLLAIPIQRSAGGGWMAVSAFACRRVAEDEALQHATQLLDVDRESAKAWINRQRTWAPQTLVKLASAVHHKLTAESKIEQLESEVEQVSHNLASTYEEISLLYRLTQNLRLTSTNNQLGQLALDWLLECMPAQGVALQFTPEPDNRSVQFELTEEPALLTNGECPISASEFSDLVATISADVDIWPYVGNRPITSTPIWRFPSVRQVIMTPLIEGDIVHGWIAAFNHIEDGEFDSMEASLINSVGAILGIHGGNQELYREQSHFMASVVRALTSAIDAKDPYTCGHSDRVARVCVRLAEQLNCERSMMKTLYMAGLLHDIGKIGISDAVLRKDGRLSDAEYEHIKLHPELGYKILVDLKQFSEVLPVVLHHHEQWDGNGYPHRLAGEDIPYMARICAVADAYDAMTSDRPYRKGMEFSRVAEIFRAGAGAQWDVNIVDAFFAAKDDIIAIAKRGRDLHQMDLHQWD